MGPHFDRAEVSGFFED